MTPRKHSPGGCFMFGLLACVAGVVGAIKCDRSWLVGALIGLSSWVLLFVVVGTIREALLWAEEER